MQQRNARMGVCADWAGRLCTSTLSSLPFLLARKHHQRQSKSSKPPPRSGWQTTPQRLATDEPMLMVH